MAGDGLTKKLLVEAEGVKREYSTSVFFCPADSTNSTFSHIMELELPTEVVPGSVYAELEFVGRYSNGFPVVFLKTYFYQ